MITTVTTTVSSTSVIGVSATLGLITTLLLLALLIGREMVSAAPDEHKVRWERSLIIGVVPLLISFIIIVAVKIAQVI